MIVKEPYSSLLLLKISYNRQIEQCFTNGYTSYSSLIYSWSKVKQFRS